MILMSQFFFFIKKKKKKEKRKKESLGFRNNHTKSLLETQQLQLL